MKCIDCGAEVLAVVQGRCMECNRVERFRVERPTGASPVRRKTARPKQYHKRKHSDEVLNKKYDYRLRKERLKERGKL